MLRTAEIIDDEVGREDEVALNKPVDLYFPEDDEEQHIRLVTSIRGNSLKGLISIESPLGRAITGRREGEHVRVNVGGGEYEVVIRKVYDAIDDSADTIKSF